MSSKTGVHLFKKNLPLTLVLLSAVSATATADTIVLKNGDTLHGSIGEVTAKTLGFKSPGLGSLKIDLANVQSYAFDEPVKVRPKARESIVVPVSGTAKTVEAGEQTYRYDELRSINPPTSAWTGSIVANFSLARGNTNRFLLGAEAAAGLRRIDDTHDDRSTFAAAYRYGESGGGPGGDPNVTDTDNWFITGKYDRFYTERFYGYVNGRLEHDRIAQLYYRITPGVGLGYQWVETPRQHFQTEAGVSYVHDEFDDDLGSDDNIALRLAYHYDYQLSDDVTVFHNLEYLPAFDNPADYILNTDIGLRANLTDDFFSQFKIVYTRDSTPAEGSLKNDLLYTIGVGWTF